METSEGQKPVKKDVVVIGGKRYRKVNLDAPDPRGDEYWKATTPYMVSKAVDLQQPKTTKPKPGESNDAMLRRVPGFRGQK